MHFQDNPFLSDPNIAQQIQDCFDTLVPGAYRSDLMRAVILYQYGGVYVDSDAKPHIGLDSIFNLIRSRLEQTSINTIVSATLTTSTNTIVSTTISARPTFIAAKDVHGDRVNYDMHNGFIMSRKRHPFLKQYIIDILYNSQVRYYGRSCFCPIGPVCFGQAIRKIVYSQQRLGTENRNPDKDKEFHPGLCRVKSCNADLYVLQLKRSPRFDYCFGRHSIAA
jgi:mannosyltransferase OCH1-like enzyme